VLRRLNRKTKGQSTAEYAILIGLVIAAAVAMQIYVKRGLQGRVHDATLMMVGQTSCSTVGENYIGNSHQYEPYYVQSQFNVDRFQNSRVNLTTGTYNARDYSETNREAGFQRYGNVQQE